MLGRNLVRDLDIGVSNKLFFEEKKASPEKSLNEHTNDTFNKDETFSPFYTSTPKQFRRISEEYRMHFLGIFKDTWT